MSHRVTTQTEIKDKALAIQALKQANMAYSESGSTLHITTGPIADAMINLTTGEVSGDTDRGHKRGDDGLGILKRFYAEAKVQQECALQGIVIEERIVEKDGRIRLKCQGHFA